MERATVSETVSVGSAGLSAGAARSGPGSSSGLRQRRQLFDDETNWIKRQ
jgi:hypothetical protein